MTYKMNQNVLRVARIAAIIIGSSILAHSQSLPSFFNGWTTCYTCICNGCTWDQLTFPGGTPFGNFYPTWDTATPPNLYITHQDLGFEYVIDGGNGSVYLYDYSSGGWLFTASTAFPAIYDFSLAAPSWLFYYLDPNPNNAGRYTSSPRYFYDFALGYAIGLGAGSVPTYVPPGVIVLNSVSIAGGGNTDNIPAYSSPPTQSSSMVPFSFTYHDSGTANGALNIAGGSISFLPQGGSSTVCTIYWGASGTMNLQYMSPVQSGIIQTDSVCSASLQSISYSTTDSSAVTVTLNVAFSSALAGTYSVISQDYDQQYLFSPSQVVGSVNISAPLATLKITTAASPSFEVDSTWYVGTASFVRQLGGDNLTVNQTPLPLNDVPAPSYGFSCTDGSAPEQAIVAPPSGESGSGNCPWHCDGYGSCHAPVPTGTPGSPPVISPGGVTGTLLAGGTAMINIAGSNFGSTAGELFFCQQGASPCVLPSGGTPMSYTFKCAECSWSDGSIEVQVTLPDSAPSGPWWVYVISLGWLPASAFSNPSMGGVEVDPAPTLAGPIGIPYNGVATFTVTVPRDLGTVPVVLTLSSSGTGSAAFTDGTTQTTLYVEGSQDVPVKGTEASSTADNMTISASAGGYEPVSLQFSVVAVSIILNTGTPVQKDEAISEFQALVLGSNPPQNASPLGAVIFYNNGDQPQNCALGVELVGTVTPSNYPGLVTLNRNIVSTAVFQGQVTDQNMKLPPPGPDNSAGGLVDNVVGAGNPSEVFDLDPPSIGPGPSPSAPERYRTNFQEYAVLGDRTSTVQVGPPFPYYVAVSCGGTSGAPAFDPTYLVNGDNAAVGGTLVGGTYIGGVVNLTYDLLVHGQ